jgi:hypothetical protein
MTAGRIPSIEGGIQPTIVDAKGDLIAAVAADTPARLAVGANDTVLTADSSTATGLKWAAPATPTSKVVQIVAASTSTQTSSGSSTYADTSLTATITPTSASNQVLAIFNQNGCGKSVADTHMSLKFLRGATTLGFHDRIGGTGNSNENFVGSVSMSFLDTPATTSATTYKVQFKNENASGTVFVQKDSINLTTSTIYLMEVTP